MLRGIDLQNASILLEKILLTARAQSYPPMAIVILDNGGHLKLAASEDGVGTLRHDIALGKANAALGMGMDSLDFSKLLAAGVLSEAFSAALVGAANGKFNPNPGGILIKEGADICGAIGASGASAMDDHRLIAGVLNNA